MANGGSVNVRFSVSDSEVVRQALERLGKDGEAALKKLDAAGKSQQGVGTFGKIVGEVKDRAASMASSLGIAGTALLSLGPTGLVAGAALGAIALGLSAVSARVGAVREAATAIKQAAEQTSFSSSQYQAFALILEQQGIEAERARASLFRFNIAHAQAAKGQGELYQVLRQVNPELAEQFATAKSGAEALERFIKARSEATKSQQVLLDKSAFGETGSALSSALREIADKGGLQAVTDEAVKLQRVMGPELIAGLDAANRKNKEVTREIERDLNHAALNIAGFWKSLNQKAGRPESETFLSFISRGFKNATEWAFGSAAKKAAEPPPAAATPAPENDEIARLWAMREKAVKDYQKYKKMAEEGESNSFHKEDAADAERAQERIASLDKKIKELTESKKAAAAQPAATPSEEEDRQRAIGALTREIQVLQQKIGVLGEAATAKDRAELRSKELDLAALQRENQLSAAQITRARTQSDLTTRAGEIAKQVQFGVADAGERRKLVEEQVSAAIANGTIKEEDRARAIALGKKVLEETIEQEKIRASLTPQLTQLTQDSTNLRKTLDQELSGALRGSTAELINMAKGTTTLGQGLKNLVMRMGEAVAQAVLLKTTIGPLANLLTGGINMLLGGGAGAGSTGAAGVGGGATGVGGGVGALIPTGGMTASGDAMSLLQSGGGGTNNSMTAGSPKGSGGMVTIAPTFAIDARGATADAAPAIVEQLKRQFLPMIVPTVRDAIARGTL